MFCCVLFFFAKSSTVCLIAIPVDYFRWCVSCNWFHLHLAKRESAVLNASDLFTTFFNLFLPIYFWLLSFDNCFTCRFLLKTISLCVMLWFYMVTLLEALCYFPSGYDTHDSGWLTVTKRANTLQYRSSATATTVWLLHYRLGWSWQFCSSSSSIHAYQR